MLHASPPDWRLEGAPGQRSDRHAVDAASTGVRMGRPTGVLRVDCDRDKVAAGLASSEAGVLQSCRWKRSGRCHAAALKSIGVAHAEEGQDTAGANMVCGVDAPLCAWAALGSGLRGRFGHTSDRHAVEGAPRGVDSGCAVGVAQADGAASAPASAAKSRGGGVRRCGSAPTPPLRAEGGHEFAGVSNVDGVEAPLPPAPQPRPGFRAEGACGQTWVRQVDVAMFEGVAVHLNCGLGVPHAEPEADNSPRFRATAARSGVSPAELAPEWKAGCSKRPQPAAEPNGVARSA